MKKIVFIIVTTFVFTTMIGYIYIKDVYANRNSYKENLIRFHVIANSDSKADQDLKLRVRDRVIKEMTNKLESSESIEETRLIVKKSLDEIKYIAKNELMKNDSKYDVNVYFGDYDFPTKSYGSFTLPAGEYEAVRIVIGKGYGKNWWCVMFPPLCFIDINHGLTDKTTKKELENVLSEEEFNMISSAKKDKEIPIKLKFKIVEVIEKNKMRFANLLVGQN
ncbi:MAG: stage II sporulation protein R [Firmicutes bacterium]|nr:stage II sporulation protein R [Bacillota bacterium]